MGFYIGNLEIRFYGIIIAAAILVAFFVCLNLFKKRGYNEDFVYILLIILVPLGIFGARVFYVVFSPDSINLFAIRDGGLAIYGAVIVGMLGVFIFTKLRRVSFFALTDIIAIGLILAQAIGRWGNFTNQEAYGLEVNFHFFPITVLIGNTPHLATFFYESLLNFVGFAVLLYIYMQRNPRVGTITALYFIYYGIVRAIIEPLRLDSLLIFGISDFVLNRISFVISILLIIAGVVILMLNRKNLINQDETGLLKKEKANDK
ncbi:MAG: prolipoprotein diacylglyceryl transferase [Firmicutes bacterium]|nr:prolipoprotein diacylglyceryl transferase [Bacillota bacterium]